MKKSEIYKMLQVIVMDYNCGGGNYEDKLAILRELMAQEDLARFKEEHEGMEALE